MKFNFKKFLCNLVLLSILIVGNNCLNICYATKPEISESNDALESSQDLKLNTIATVFIEYTETLKLDLKFDPTDLGLNGGLNFVNAFNMDCKHVEETKKGVCKHFCNYLIKRLRAKGVEAYPLYLNYADETKKHQSVLYRAGSEFFVADITSDIVAIQNGDSSRKNNPLFFADELDRFIKYSREEKNAIQIFYIDADLTDSSVKIDDPKDLASRIRVLYSAEDIY